MDNQENSTVDVEAQKKAAAEAKAQAKAIADAAKAEAKAKSDAAKKEAKEKADAAKAEAKAAKEQATAQAKAAKEAEAAKKAQEKAEKAAAAAAEKTKVVQVQQNGVTRPKAEGACGKVWAIADALSAQLRQPVPIATLIKATTEAGLNDATTRTQYARWKTFNGVFGVVPKLPEAPAASTDKSPETAPA